MRFLVTGGCGFIGSAAVRKLIRDGHDVLNIDKLTYAGDRRTVQDVAHHPNYRFQQIDILDEPEVGRAFAAFAPQYVLHFAAETHVDRSIDAAGVFIDTNIRGTLVLLQAALSYWRQLDPASQNRFRFIQISTDEVYGSLGAEGFFTETSLYQPNSPYSASKAGADHLVRAWHKTFGLPTIISNCSNNYGPFQHREKLIPTIIRKAISGRPIPIYGTGSNVRDWLYVDDHISALIAMCERAVPGDRFNIGGRNEVSNADLARQLCTRLDTVQPRADGRSYAEHIHFVTDRPGHDHRYAIDPDKASRELGWRPREKLATGLEKTVAWYLDHPEWTLDGSPDDDRLGLGLSPAAALGSTP